MLEFHVGPESPYFLEAFGDEKEFGFYRAVGSRSALAAQRAGEMGLERVANVDGGLNAWKEAGGSVEEPKSTV